MTETMWSQEQIDDYYEDLDPWYDVEDDYPVASQFDETETR